MTLNDQEYSFAKGAKSGRDAIFQVWILQLFRGWFDNGVGDALGQSFSLSHGHFRSLGRLGREQRPSLRNGRHGAFKKVI